MMRSSVGRVGLDAPGVSAIRQASRGTVPAIPRRLGQARDQARARTSTINAVGRRLRLRPRAEPASTAAASTSAPSGRGSTGCRKRAGPPPAPPRSHPRRPEPPPEPGAGAAGGGWAAAALSGTAPGRGGRASRPSHLGHGLPPADADPRPAAYSRSWRPAGYLPAFSGGSRLGIHLTIYCTLG